MYYACYYYFFENISPAFVATTNYFASTISCAFLIYLAKLYIPIALLLLNIKITSQFFLYLTFSLSGNLIFVDLKTEASIFIGSVSSSTVYSPGPGL